MKNISVLFALVLLMPNSGRGEPVDTVDIDEWQVPWPQTRPRDPFDDGRGHVWFVGQTGDYLAALDPNSGEFKRFELDDGTGPHNLIVAQDGRVWYAGNRATHIGVLDPQSGAITKYVMPQEAARDPHTLIFGQKNNIWFTVQHGNFIGRLDMMSGEVELIAVPTPESRPYGIVVDDELGPWFAEFGTNKLGRVDMENLTITEFELPRHDSRPRRLAITSDDKVWYVDYAGGFIGRIDPESGIIAEWPSPAGSLARPYGMIVDRNDNLWFVECGPRPNRLVGFSPEKLEFISVTQIPSGGGAVRHMHYDAAEHEIWFGTDTNTIGRARLPTAAR